jgi:hypothetical protein
MIEPARSRLAAFFVAGGCDEHGRTLADIVEWDDATLERVHSYIQWLFPLPEPSRAVPGSPILTDADRAIIRASSSAQGAIDRAAARMLLFYRDTDHWLTRVDHNHLRISRIIRSLRLVRGDIAANAFRTKIVARVDDAGSPVDPSALDHWRKA